MDYLHALGIVVFLLVLLFLGTLTYNYLNTGVLTLFERKPEASGPYAGCTPEWIKHVRSIMPVSWIPITEKAPEQGQIVITYHKETGVDIMECHIMKDEFGTIMFVSRLGFLTDDVTHWLPLHESIQKIMRDTGFIPTHKEETEKTV